MSYKIQITKIESVPSTTATEVDRGVSSEVFTQTVDSLNLKAVINAINATPRKPRVTKAKA